MGGSASKTARKLPTTTASVPRPLPKWAGARTPHAEPLYPEGSEAPKSGQKPLSSSGQYNQQASSRSTTGGGRPTPSFTGEKDDAIRQDAMDPQFMANLSKLGQVQVPDASQFVRAPSMAQRTLKARQNIHTTETSLPPPGNLTAPLLINLLDRLKTLSPGEDPTRLYAEYGMDSGIMNDIRKYVNSVSVGEEDDVRVEEGNRIVEMKAVWIDSAVEASSRPKDVPPPTVTTSRTPRT